MYWAKIQNRSAVKKKKKVQQVGITAPETKHTPECITNRIRKLTAITFHILM